MKTFLTSVLYLVTVVAFFTASAAGGVLAVVAAIFLIKHVPMLKGFINSHLSGDLTVFLIGMTGLLSIVACGLLILKLVRSSQLGHWLSYRFKNRQSEPSRNRPP